MENFFLRLDGKLERAEERPGKAFLVVFLGLLFLLFSALVTSLRFEPVHHGKGFTQLSLHPFNFSDTNDLRFRILSPLLGYLFFFRGEAFKYFMLLILVIFSGLIYFFFRREKYRPSEALFFVGMASFSTLSFHQLYFPAYNDPLSYLLILLFLFNFRKEALGMVLLCLMLFNHENTLFLFPFFFLLCLGGEFSLKNFLSISLRFIPSILLYFLYRKFVSMHQPVEYSFSYYFDPHNMQWTREHVLPNLVSGIFQAFRLFWIFPLIALGVDLYEKRFGEMILILVAIAGVSCQFFIAYDISRLAGLAFPAIFLGASRTKQYLGSEKFLLFFCVVMLLNFLVPSVYVGALEPIPLKPFWL